MKNPDYNLIQKAKKELSYTSKWEDGSSIEAYQWDQQKKILRLPRYWKHTPKPRQLKEPMHFDSEYPFLGKLFPHQAESWPHLKDALDKLRGAVGTAPPGSGKTVMGLYAIHDLCPRRAIIVVDTDSVRRQWIAAGHRFLDVEIKKLKFDAPITEGIWVTTYAAMAKHPELCHEAELMILDEADKVSAPKFVNTIFGINFRISLALTATPDRQDNLDIVYRIMAAPLLVPLGSNSFTPEVHMVPYVHDYGYGKYLMGKDKFLRILALSKNLERNDWLVEMIYRAHQRGRKIIGLSKYKQQLYNIQQLLKDKHGINAGMYTGDQSQSELEKSKQCNVILATSQKGGRGLDIPDLDALVLLVPHLDARQQIGRIMRPKGKTPQVLDPIDYNIANLENQALARKKIYQESGYIIHQGD